MGPVEGLYEGNLGDVIGAAAGAGAGHVFLGSMLSGPPMLGGGWENLADRLAGPGSGLPCCCWPIQG